MGAHVGLPCLGTQHDLTEYPTPCSSSNSEPTPNKRKARFPSSEVRRSLAGTDEDPGVRLDLAIRCNCLTADIRVSIGENEHVDFLKRMVLDADNRDLPTSALRLFFYGVELTDSKQLKCCPGIESDVVVIGTIHIR